MSRPESGAPNGTPLLETTDLTKHFSVRRGTLGFGTGLVRAVDSISFTIDAATTLGLVGVSGCGKTTTSRLILGLERPTAGRIRFEGKGVATLGRDDGRHYPRSVQPVFQDPYAWPDPRMPVSPTVAAPPPGGRAARSRRAPRARGDALSARVLGRPAPAHRHRAGARARAEARRARRAGVGARRVDSRPDPEPAPRPPAAPGRVVSLHRARPGRGRPHEPHDRRHVPGEDRGVGRRRGGGTGAAASVHEGAVRGGAAHRPRRPARRGDAGRRGAEPARSSRGAPRPSAVSVRAAPVRDRGARAANADGTARRLSPLLKPPSMARLY